MALVTVDTKGHSERASVLVCAAVLDRAVEKLLRLKFKQLSEASDEDLDVLLTNRPLPPLGSAAIRVKVAAVMGVLSRDVCKALSIMFKIRNEFAHDEIPESLAYEKVEEIYNLIPSAIQESHIVPDTKGTDAVWFFIRVTAMLFVIISRAQYEISDSTLSDFGTEPA